MFCPNCGSPIPEGSAFCPQCGNRITPVEPIRSEPASPYTQTPTAAYSEPVSSPYQRTAVELPHSGEVNSFPIQEVQYTQPQRSVNGVLAGALTAVSILLAAACVLLFIKPGYLRQAEVEPLHDTDTSFVSSKDEERSSKPYESTATENEDDESDEESSSVFSSKSSSKAASSKKSGSSKAVSSKVTSSKVTSSKKAASSKAASSKVTSSKKAASSKAASSKAASSKPASSKVTSSKASSSKVTSSKAASSAAPKPESVPAPSEPEPQPESKPDTPIASEPETNEDEQAYNESLVYSTEQRPKFEEFEWCYGQYGLVYDMPPTAYKLTNDLGFNGGWKCMIIYNPTNSSGTYIRELNNVHMYVQNGLVDLVIDWYMISNDVYAEPENEEDMKDIVYNGSSLNGGVSVSNTETNTSLILSSFWKEGGYEYAVGSMLLGDGTVAYVALYR